MSAPTKDYVKIMSDDAPPAPPISQKFQEITGHQVFPPYIHILNTSMEFCNLVGKRKAHHMMCWLFVFLSVLCLILVHIFVVPQK